MKRSEARSAIPVACFCVAMALLSACAPKDNSIEPPSTAKPPPAPVAANTSSALPGVIAFEDTLHPGNPGTGPAQGSTAIGGMIGKQESGGQTSGSPAPTGGDRSAGTPAPAK
ncbi:hypothetical protein BH09PSE5_BH09PSE5_04490 [soil metagenome]